MTDDEYEDFLIDREIIGREINEAIDIQNAKYLENSKMNHYNEAVKREREQNIQSWIKAGLTRDQAEFMSIMWD